MILLKIKRQDDPSDLPYWEEFEIEPKEGMTVAAVLESLRESPVNAENNATTPVVFESSCMEGACGACTMIINGKVRQACQTFLNELDSPVHLEPLTKFPVVRDLKTDRSRMFESISNLEIWIDVDGVSEKSLPIRMQKEKSDKYQLFNECVVCGACLEGCPQVNARSAFYGAFIFSQILSLHHHPIGAFDKTNRLDMVVEGGSVVDCANAGVCEKVCPKGIPLTEARAELGWLATGHAIKRFFRG